MVRVLCDRVFDLLLNTLMSTRFGYVLVLCIVSVNLLHVEDWPHWRGPDGRRIVLDGSLPTAWSDQDRVAWRTPLRGLGVSSPIVVDDLVVLTSQVGRGRFRAGGHPALVRGGPDPESELPLGGERLSGDGAEVVCLVSAFHWADGGVAWEYALPAEGVQPDAHQKHNMASPSAASDGERIYAWFATGQPVWSRHLAREYGPFDIVWGHSSSPTIYADLVVL